MSYLLPSRFYLSVSVLVFLAMARFDPLDHRAGEFGRGFEPVLETQRPGLTGAERALVEARFDATVQTMLATTMALFVPLVAIVLKLLRRAQPFVIHLVFGFHASAFVLVAQVPGMLLQHRFMVDWLALAVIGAYLFQALSTVYGSSGVRRVLEWAVLYATVVKLMITLKAFIGAFSLFRVLHGSA